MGLLHRNKNEIIGDGRNIEIYNKDIIQSSINGVESSEEEDSFEHDYNKYGYYLRQQDNNSDNLEQYLNQRNLIDSQ